MQDELRLSLAFFAGADTIISFDFHRLAKVIKHPKTIKGKPQVYLLTANLWLGQLQFWERNFVQEEVYKFFDEVVPTMPNLERMAICITMVASLAGKAEVDNVGYFWGKLLADYLRKKRKCIPDDSPKFYRRLVLDYKVGNSDRIEIQIMGKLQTQTSIF